MPQITDDARVGEVLAARNDFSECAGARFGSGTGFIEAATGHEALTLAR
jgi:hypothetical protein